VTSGKVCALATCLDPQGIGCNRGFDFLEDCPDWKKGQQPAADPGTIPVDPTTEVDSPSATSDTGRHLRLPWTGNSLGTLDLEIVTACNRTTLLGILGPYNSGKTTLLTLIYLLIQRGEQASMGQFAGSWSLIGWENLAANLRWVPGEGGPKFPPHTSRKAGRRPGMLHLALRDSSNIRRDFLLTDPPGEWFSTWAQKESAEGAEGARWVQQRADRFMFLVDREAESILVKPCRHHRGTHPVLVRIVAGGIEYLLVCQVSGTQ
jgi:Double-GTPase 2